MDVGLVGGSVGLEGERNEKGGKGWLGGGWLRGLVRNFCLEEGETGFVRAGRIRSLYLLIVQRRNFQVAVIAAFFLYYLKYRFLLLVSL